ncbi:MAG: 2-oxoacid:acceptor oxidoreductase subunit alpha, partial [Deltaproteobacteria bacterium]|nr:2-oxoacid:acceptor oxidoreductase subunit alpha [Deltaproteobacteria bacterium]
AGCRFFAGYPITPASEIAEQMALKLSLNDGIYMQMEDEIASIVGVVGATWGGMKACTATSGPGFSLMQEGIGFAAMTETPCVIIDVMRGGPATGQPTLSSQQDVMQAKYGAHGDYEIIALCPSSVQEAYDLTIKAFNLAETFRVPVIILSDEIVGHTREKIRISPDVEIVERTKPSKPPETYKPYEPLESGLLDGMPAFGQGYKLLIDGQCHDEMGNRAGNNSSISGKLVKRLCEKITGHSTELEDVEDAFLEDADSVVVAYGSVARSALDAVKKARAQGLKVGFIRMKILWPFPERAIREAIRNARRVIVPEMNIGKICHEVERLASDGQEVISLSRLGGVLHSPDEIIKAIKG